VRCTSDSSVLDLGPERIGYFLQNAPRAVKRALPQAATCGGQYAEGERAGYCVICEEKRQYVPLLMH
jgi:hypothetical protein